MFLFFSLRCTSALVFDLRLFLTHCGILFLLWFYLDLLMVYLLPSFDSLLVFWFFVTFDPISVFPPFLHFPFPLGPPFYFLFLFQRVLFSPSSSFASGSSSLFPLSLRLLFFPPPAFRTLPGSIISLAHHLLPTRCFPLFPPPSTLSSASALARLHPLASSRFLLLFSLSPTVFLRFHIFPSSRLS